MIVCFPQASRSRMSWSLMMLTPTYFTSNSLEACPWADYTLFEQLLQNSSLSSPKGYTRFWGHEPTVSPFARQSNKALLFWNEVLATQSYLTLCEPMDCSPPGSSVHGISQIRILEWVAISFSRDSSQPGIEPGFPALQADSLPSETPRKPKESQSVTHSDMPHSLRPHGLKPARLLCPWNSPGNNTRVGSHSLLQGIFLTQGLNLGFPHSGQILYSLSQ